MKVQLIPVHGEMMTLQPLSTSPMQVEVKIYLTGWLNWLMPFLSYVRAVRFRVGYAATQAGWES